MARAANVQRQSDRRDEILAAAQRCFVRSGFHQTSMHEICAEAGMSPGNLYRYFPSKESLIAGIAEQDRAEVAQSFAGVDMSRGLFAVLEGLAYRYFKERSDEQVKICTEVMSEARRHAEIARISNGFDADVRRWLIELFKVGAARGDIPNTVDFENAATIVMIMADGMFWRRALDPHFNPDIALPLFMDVVRHVLSGNAKNATAGASR
jgi:AcrR family transcriptional regulator